MNKTVEQLSFISEEQKQDSRRHTLRLRERLLNEHGFDSFDDIDILSTILSYASGNKDSTGLVKRLLDSFGSLKAILEARPEQLLRVDGMNKTRAGLISLIRILETFHQFGRFSCSRDCRLPYIHIPHLTAVINPTEVVRNFCLDSAGKTGSATKKDPWPGPRKIR